MSRPSLPPVFDWLQYTHTYCMQLKTGAPCVQAFPGYTLQAVKNWIQERSGHKATIAESLHVYIYRTSVHASACVHIYPRYIQDLLFEESRNYLRSSTPWLMAHFLENSAIQLQCSLIANSLTDINAAYILLLPLYSVKITQMYSVPCFTVIPDFILPLVFLDSARVLLSAV